MSVKKTAGDLELLDNGVIRKKGTTDMIMRLVYSSDEDAESVLKFLAATRSAKEAWDIDPVWGTQQIINGQKVIRGLSDAGITVHQSKVIGERMGLNNVGVKVLIRLLARHANEELPECGHSACRQNFIETGETLCVQGEHDG